MLTGNKDVDRKILNELNDEDLVRVCQVNKKSNEFCNNDQVFWMNRVFDRYGYVGNDVLKRYKKDRSWSEYYIQDLRKINKNNSQNYLIESNGRLDLVIISLKNGADIHTQYDDALKLSSQNGHLEVVKYLKSLN